MSLTLTGPSIPGKAVVLRQTVFFEGSGDLELGTAVCFSRTYGTATDADEERDRRVNVPDATNQMDFAGIVMRRYTGRSGGQIIEIARPGSVVPVLTDGAVTAIRSIGGFISNHASANANVGKFSVTYNNGRGKGSVQFLQTSAAAGTVMAKLLEGAQVGGIEIFTAAASAVISAFGTSVVTRDASNRTLAALPAGSAPGQRKRLRVLGATATTVTMPVGTNLGSRQGTGASAGEQEHHVTYSNVVAPSGGTQSDTNIVHEWTGTHWRLISTTAAHSGQFT